MKMLLYALWSAFCSLSTLSAASGLSVQSRQYHSENLSQRFLLIGITDERGVRVSSWTYDTFGRVKTANHGDELETRSYAYARNQVTETDPLGTSRTYRYSMFR